MNVLLEVAAICIAALYALVLFIAWLGFSLSPKKNNSAITEHSVAVVVAVRNEAQHIPSLLQSLAVQDYPFMFDVIVVNDHSDDEGKTEEALRNFSSERFRLHILEATGTGKKAALSQGIASTQAEVILVTDGDCITGRSWVRTSAALLTDGETAFVAGLVSYSESGILRTVLETEMMILQVVSAGFNAVGAASMCNGASMGFTKTFFDSAGGFSGNPYASGDDVLLLHKAKRAGKKVKWNYDHAAVVRTAPAPDIGAAILQRRRWLSKASGYGFSVLSFSGLVFFLAQLLLPSAIFGSVVAGSVGNPLVYALLIKTAVELLLLSLTAPRFGEYKVIPAFPLSVILYDVIALGTAFSSVRRDITWKGRTWKHGKMA